MDCQKQVENWLRDVVLGLNLCPFAEWPVKENLVKFSISSAEKDEDILEELKREFAYLDEVSPSVVETTLLVLPTQLSDFYQYNDFLDKVDALIIDLDREGIYQVASFHPDYQFAGTGPDDKENLTNRSPFPIFHIIREQSLETAIATYPDIHNVPKNNIERILSLDKAQIKSLFHYLYKD